MRNFKTTALALVLMASPCGSWAGTTLNDLAKMAGGQDAAAPAVDVVAPAVVSAQAVDPELTYSAMYASGRAPQPGEILGDWKGAAVVFAQMRPLPRSPLLDRFIEAVTLRFWNGKTFLAAGGVNRLLGGRLKLFGFTTLIQPSRTGAGEALALNYGANAYPVSAIRDEVRLLADGRLLGRAYMHAPDGKDHFLFFFMLQKEGVSQ